MHLSLSLCFISICLSIYGVPVECNRSYTKCISCMVPVLHMEQELMLNLQNYKIKIKEKLEVIKIYVDNLRKEYKKSDPVDPEVYLSNPLIAFALMRRMHSDWIKWRNYMHQQVGEAPEDIQLKIKTAIDLKAVSNAIVRIQETYQLNAKVMASGILNGKQYDARFSALDCFAIADYTFKEAKYEPALNWYNVSLELHTKYDDTMSKIHGLDKAEIWNSIAYAYYKMGDNKRSAHALKKAVEYRPHDNELLKVAMFNGLYEKQDNLCRGDIPQKSKLFCRYNSTTTPFLKLAPMKMEEVSIDPYIVLYHDIIYDSEIDELKRLSLPQFERSLVGDGMLDPDYTGQEVYYHSSIKSLVVDRINERLIDITGFVFTEDNNLQVVSYGIGGHYNHHLDYEVIKLPAKWSTIGNRIGTILIYLNDVKEGGGTAFVSINKVIKPKKGMALLWHNLDNSGNGILETMHASCPVLVGSKWEYIILVQCNQNNRSTRSYATCVACMAEVLLIEDDLMLNLQRYKVKLKEKLEIIKFYTNNLQREHTKSEVNPEEYLSNPLEAFKLIRRMHADWFKWQDFMKDQAINKTLNDFIDTIQYRMPTRLDFQEANAGIVRIHETYQMNAKILAKGIFNGEQYDSQFTALDCCAVGNYLFDQTKYKLALNWYNLCLELYTNEDIIMNDLLGLKEGDIWYFISKTYLKLGDFFLNNEFYEKGINSLKIAQKFKPNDMELVDMKDSIRLHLRLNKLCRGEVPQKSKLHCRYNTTTTPFLKLAPLKLEEIARDPYIVLYHDVIYENEIEELKRLSVPQLHRGFVGLGIPHAIRTVQRADLYMTDTILIERFNQRTDDITGLDFSKNLKWEVVNYGIGGHYDSHYDYYNFSMYSDARGRGNRLAAIIYYMSDIGMGGDTAFVEIDTVVKPKKGSAIFWYHLDNTGEGNYKTLHASCPVLMGSKWMFIKLAYYKPNMFRKPCHKTVN